MAMVRGSPTIDKAGTSFFVTEDGYIRAIGSDGSVRWTHFLGGSGVTSSSPALSCDGTIYVGTSHGHVVALQADSDGIADSSWPKYQHDNRNTGNLATKIYDNGVCVE
jgi:outer membrane protein assembly factor BamB